MNKSQLRFIVLLVVIYLMLYYFCLFWIGICSEGGLYWEFAANHLNFIKWYREFLISSAEFSCNILGLKTISNATDMRIIGKGGIRIVYSCLGYGIMSLLLALGIALPNKPVKERIVFILSSLSLFILFNITRIILVAYYAGLAKKHNLDHHSIFNYICYIFIFIGIYWWINKKTSDKWL